MGLLNDFTALPLDDREFALLRSTVARFSEDAARLTTKLETQAGNPLITEDGRRLYVLAVSDIEQIEANLSTAIEAASTDRRVQLIALRRWVWVCWHRAAGGNNDGRTPKSDSQFLSDAGPVRGINPK